MVLLLLQKTDLNRFALTLPSDLSDRWPRPDAQCLEVLRQDDMAETSPPCSPSTATLNGAGPPGTADVEPGHERRDAAAESPGTPSPLRRCRPARGYARRPDRTTARRQPPANPNPGLPGAAPENRPRRASATQVRSPTSWSAGSAPAAVDLHVFLEAFVKLDKDVQPAEELLDPGHDLVQVVGGRAPGQRAEVLHGIVQ